MGALMTKNEGACGEQKRASFPGALPGSRDDGGTDGGRGNGGKRMRRRSKKCIYLTEGGKSRRGERDFFTSA